MERSCPFSGAFVLGRFRDGQPVPYKKQARFRGPVNILFYFILIQPGKELIIAAPINFPQLDEHAGPDVQFTGFIFGVGRSANITSTALKLCTEFFLRYPGIITQSSQVVAHIAVTPYFLFHFITPAIPDQYWLQSPIFYAIMLPNIDLYTGQKWSDNEMELSEVLTFISQADDGQLNDISHALSARYKILFPDWEVAYLALPLHDPQRRAELLELARKTYL